MTAWILMLAQAAALGHGRTAAGRDLSRAPTAPLSVPLPPGAAFAALSIEVDRSACDRTGCPIRLVGVARSGERKDVTATEVLPNGFLGTRGQMIGPADAGGMPLVTLEQGNAEADDSFNVFRYDVDARRYRFAGTVERYGASLDAPRRAEPAAVRPAVVPKAPGSGRTISYAGPATYKSISAIQDLELTFAGDAITGTFAQKLFGVLITSRITGEVANGVCTVRLRSDRLVGPCDAHRFTGRRLSRKDEVMGTFDYANADELAPVGPAARR